MKFSLGYNNDLQGFIELINKYKNNIGSIYFAPPQKIANSLREESFNDEEHEKDIIKLIQICKNSKIRSIMLLNATSEGRKTGSIKNMLEKISYIKKMHKFGLDAISITNSLHIQFIKKSTPEIIIYSSVNCQIKELEMARNYMNLGIDILTIPEEKNRDFKFIEDIKNKLGLKIQVMLNEGCIRNCPFRDIHGIVSSHGGEFDETGNEFNLDGLIPTYHCVGYFKKNKRMIFRSSFIRPEDISYYEDRVDYFKIVSRNFESQKIEKILLAYINRKYSGNLFDIVDFPVDPNGKSINYIDNDLLTEKNFFEEIQKCPSDCDTCTACNKYLL